MRNYSHRKLNEIASYPIIHTTSTARRWKFGRSRPSLHRSYPFPPIHYIVCAHLPLPVQLMTDFIYGEKKIIAFRSPWNNMINKIFHNARKGLNESVLSLLPLLLNDSLSVGS